MSAESDAKRIAAGGLPGAAHLGPGGSPGVVAPGVEEPAVVASAGVARYDPLRLCVFATIALIGWLTGPVGLVAFAVLGFLGYARARRAGLTRSKCVLRDTRLVLAYLAVLVGAGVWGTIAWLT